MKYSVDLLAFVLTIGYVLFSVKFEFLSMFVQDFSATFVSCLESDPLTVCMCVHYSPSLVSSALIDRI